MKKKDCIFCNIMHSLILHSSNSFFIIKDNFPVSPGHLLIVSRNHLKDYFDLVKKERNELNDLILVAKNIIEKDNIPTGYNIGINCGADAGQTIMHFHCHVIPRYKGDMKDPRGGIRHCIEGKGYY